MRKQTFANPFKVNTEKMTNGNWTDFLSSYRCLKSAARHLEAPASNSLVLCSVMCQLVFKTRLLCWICPQCVRARTANTHLGLNRDIPPICKANYHHFILMLYRAGVLSYVDFIELCHGELISLDLHLEMFLCSTPSGPFQRERCNHRILMTWHFLASLPPLQHKVVSVHQS